ncbi:MAG: OsmC family protein [Gammaproteobacteria bacterium]|nr:OsmC family protein [Gammaproteobacteria bacterium]
MQGFPHHYRVTATSASSGDVRLTASGLPELLTQAPAEFGGPGDRWSPETLLAAAVADCFVLSFRAIANASKFEYASIECDVEGVLDRVERTMKFTAFTVRARLSVPAGADEARAHKLLEKAEQSCLITNSLSCETHLEAEVLSADG